MAATLIALITDFGWRDGYVGAVKGVIMTLNPEVKILDVAHEIPSHDILAGALVLEGVFDYFPPKTVFLTVVDPGVGGKRRGIVVEVEGKYLVGPDNGLFTFVLKRKSFKAYEIRNRDYLLPEISATFHGRDVFAPVAAHLSLGVKPEQFGPIVESAELAFLPLIEPIQTPEGIQGEVIYVDRFGNLITNLKPMDLPQGSFIIEVEGEIIREIKSTYEEGEFGEVIALWGSHGRLELATKRGSLASKKGWGIGTKVKIRKP